MTTSQRGFLARIWFGFWGLIDSTRRALFNLIFLGLIVLLLAALIKGDAVKPVRENTTLLLQPVGLVVEEYTLTPFERTLNEVTDNQEVTDKPIFLMMSISY